MECVVVGDEESVFFFVVGGLVIDGDVEGDDIVGGESMI